MQKRIKNYLDGFFPLFLSYPQGRMYFTVLTVITAVFINLLQPWGLQNWNEYHKWLIINGYIMIYAGIYYLIFHICSNFRPEYYKPDGWTRRKEFGVLMLYLPVVGFASWVFTKFAIEKFEWDFPTFIRMQFHNSIIGLLTLTPFGYLVSTKIKSESIVPSNPAPVNNPTEEVQPIEDKYIVVKNFQINVSEILVVESKKNDVYIRLFHKGELKEIITRSTLKEFKLKLIDFPQFQYCHQSYLVNLNKIEFWSTDKDKLYLHLKNYAEAFKVSTNYRPFIKEILNKRIIPKLK